MALLCTSVPKLHDPLWKSSYMEIPVLHVSGVLACPGGCHNCLPRRGARLHRDVELVQKSRLQQEGSYVKGFSSSFA